MPLTLQYMADVLAGIVNKADLTSAPKVTLTFEDPHDLYQFQASVRRDFGPQELSPQSVLLGDLDKLTLRGIEFRLEARKRYGIS